MTRPGAITLLILNLLLGGANGVIALQFSRTGSGMETGTNWERWASMSPAERLASVRRYEALSLREDGRDTLRRARDFARLPAPRQERLRGLMGMIDEVLRAQSPDERRALLRSPERVRALLVFQRLAAEDPQRIEALQAEWSGG